MVENRLSNQPKQGSAETAEPNNKGIKIMNQIKQIKVGKTNLISLMELENLVLEVIRENIVHFASGKQTYFVIEHNGQEFEIPERFCSAVYYQEAA